MVLYGRDSQPFLLKVPIDLKQNFLFRLLQKFEQEILNNHWCEAKAICCQYLRLLEDSRTSIGYPHKAFEAGSHALTCLLWKMHGNGLKIEEELEPNEEE